MNAALLAISPVSTWGIADWLIFVVVILGMIAVATIGARVAGFVIPQWVWQILGIVLAVLLVVAAIRFMSTL